MVMVDPLGFWLVDVRVLRWEREAYVPLKRGSATSAVLALSGREPSGIGGRPP